jgi:hypothetical protein
VSQQSKEGIVMDLTYLRVLSVGGILVVGLLVITGAIVISLLVAGVAQAGLAVADRLARMRIRRTGVTRQPARTSETQAVGPSLEFDRGTAHELLARQAWWRLRC